MMELLSPAGSPEAVQAAVQNGADAVYLGFGQFNARRNARNFSSEGFEAAVSYCHLHGVKVYLTFNTLLTDRELPLAAQAIGTASDLGVDAVLVQDLGALRMIRQTAPDLPIHASTQMSLHNLDGVLRAADLGLTRAVLARELSQDQIAHICAHSPIEIEVFVHGALCMCYSGQCYFSSVIGGRSGNRGLCAQPCRLTYGFPGKPAQRHLLSLKDMSLANHLQALEEMGVACIKIEGRMKRPDYVAVVTAVYAKALRTGNQPTPKEQAALAAAFSREGFTDGYFLGTPGPNMFGVRKERGGPIPEVDDICRAAETPIPIHMNANIRAGAPIRLSVSDEAGHEAIATGRVPEPALHKVLTGEQLETNLKKTGATPYVCASMETEVEEGLSLPVSAINALRREALEELSRLRTAVLLRRHGAYCPVPPAPPRKEAPGLIFSVTYVEQLGDELLSLAPMEVYLPLEEAAAHPDRVGALLERGIPLSVSLPRILWDREQSEVEAQLDAVQALGVSSVLAGNLGQFSMVLDRGMALRGDFGLNVYNSGTLEMLKQLGVQSAAASFELRLAQVRDLSKCMDLELLAYGRLPLMVTENCAIQGSGEDCACPTELVDRKGARFPVIKQPQCRNLILNSQILFLGDKLPQLRALGLWGLRLAFTTETPAQCVQAARFYTEQDAGMPDAYTRGLYYREVE